MSDRVPLCERGLLEALAADVVEIGPRVGGPRRTKQKIDQRQVATQRATQAMWFDRIEPTERGQRLQGVLADPGPRAHLERERQEAATARDRTIIEVVPEIAGDRVRPRGRLDLVDVV